MDYFELERNESKRLYLSSLLISAIFVSFLSLFFFKSPYYGEGPKLFALISLTFVCSTFILFLKTRNRKHILFLPTISLTWVYFQRRFLMSDEIYYLFRNIPIDYINEIAFYPSLGIIALYIGYYAFINKKIKPLSSTGLRFKNDDLALFVRIFFALYIVDNFFKYVLNIYLDEIIGQLAQLFEFLPTLLLALMVLLYMREKRFRILYIPILFLLSFEFLSRVAGTLFAHIIILFMGGFLIYIFEKKKIPYVALAIFIIVNIPIYLTRMDYRYAYALEKWYGGVSSGYFDLVSEGLDRFTDQDFSTIFSKSDREKWNYVSLEKDRFEQVSFLGQCVYKHTNGDFEFHYGKTFWWLPLTPIPRIIFPSKPKNIMATTVAEEYGIKGSSHGAMNFPMLVEYYINFNFVGIIIFCFFQGILLSWIVRIVGFGYGDLNLLILLNILFHFLRIEANITMVFGAFLQALFFWWVLIRFLKLERRFVLKT